MVNKVVLIGRLGETPEVKTIGTDNTVSNFSMVTEDPYKNKMGEWESNPTWHRVVAWGYQGTKAAKYSKGDKVYVEGKIDNTTWTDESGATRYKSVVKIDNIILLEANINGSKKDGDSKPNIETGKESNDVPF